MQNSTDAHQENLIDKVDNEIFLINESLHAPSLTIPDKLLGSQNLAFEQLTTPAQKLLQLFEKVTSTNF